MTYELESFYAVLHRIKYTNRAHKGEWYVDGLAAYGVITGCCDTMEEAIEEFAERLKTLPEDFQPDVAQYVWQRQMDERVAKLQFAEPISW